MHYGSGLARTGGATLVIGGVSFTPLWQIAIVLAVIVAGGLLIHRSGKHRRT